MCGHSRGRHSVDAISAVSRRIQGTRTPLQLCIHIQPVLRNAALARFLVGGLSPLSYMLTLALLNRSSSSIRQSPLPSNANSDPPRLVITLWRPMQPESLVNEQLPDEAVGGGEDGGEEDDADGDQLRGDLLQGADALGDGVGYA